MNDGGTNAAIERPAPRAVFLSYASQDAEAARALCTALQAAGVEVWFDQTDLVGGDAWDAKIRGQIKACALFVPIISANTQARHEGYFRIEWKLAAQRTHAMAEGTPFLLPVVIDDTPEPEALVPAEFREVQWTLLRQGVGGQALGAEAFCGRVRAMLGGRRVARATATHSPLPPRESAPPRGVPARRVWPAMAVVLGLTVGGAMWWWASPRPAARDEAGGRKPAGAETRAAQAPGAADELARLRRKIVPDQWEKGDYAVVSATLDRLLQAEPENAEAWAVRSIVNSLQTIRQFDRGAKPLELGKSAADRALRLAPELPLGELAHALHLIAMLSRGGDDDAYRSALDRVLAKLPRDPLTRFTQLLSYYHAYDFAGAERSAHAWLAEEPEAVFPAWILSSTYVASRRADDAEKWVPVAAGNSSITAIRAFVTQFEVRYYLRADLAGARAALENVPRNGRAVHRVVHAQWLLAMAEKRWDEALQALQRLPEAMFTDRTYHGPRALLAGLAHRGAGRAEAAATQFREAERVLRELLANDPDNEALHAALAVALACTGRAADARSALGQVEPLVSGRPPSLYRGPLVAMIAHAYREMNDAPALARWLRKLFLEPCDVPFTPESLRFDPRFAGALEAPELQALLREVAAGAKLGATTPGPGPAIAAASVGNAAPEKSVAVLPFKNLSGDPAREFLSDGLSEAVAEVLGRVPGLKVVGSTSAFSFKGKNVPVPEIARQLGVTHVVEGTVLQDGQTVRITAKLLLADGFPAWQSDRLERELKNIFALHDEVAGLIASRLELKLGAGSAAAKSEVAPEAFELYVQARQAWGMRTTDGFTRAELLLKQALAIEPEFARAHAALADVWTTRAGAEASLGLFRLRGSAVIQKSTVAAQQAINLDARLAEAHAALGNIAWNDWRVADAISALRTAVTLNSNYASAHQWLGRVMATDGRMEESLAALRRAHELEPLSHKIADNLGIVLFSAGRHAEALALADRAQALQPNSIWAGPVRAWALAELGRAGEAIAAVGSLSDEKPATWKSHVAFALARAGARSEAEAMLNRVEPADWSSSAAAAFLVLGRRDDCWFALEKGSRNILAADALLFWPVFDPIRSETRFHKMLAELGLTEAHARAQAWRAANPPENREARR